MCSLKTRKICKWYSCCPIKKFTDMGKLDPYWVENYCLAGNQTCLRYIMEENGEFHPENMLPDGTIKEI
ncbi:MAG: hypothetical protein RBR08_10470 [Desulforegulaceae bacterium]|nr:hypothetical protein [Desulforegulaceae bacterium]